LYTQREKREVRKRGVGEEDTIRGKTFGKGLRQTKGRGKLKSQLSEAGPGKRALGG